MSERIINEAEQIGREYAQRKTKEAVDRLDDKVHGVGCGCKSCVLGAVRNANQWSDFMTRGTNPTKAIVKWKQGVPTVQFKKNPNIKKDG